MDLPQLNFPNIILKTKLVKGTTQVFDVVRKKYFQLTGEEWVRQHCIHYLNNYKDYPFGLMGVEKLIRYNTLRNRADIVIYNKEGNPYMIVECKAASVSISQDTFYQIAKYNAKLRVKYLLVTNGLVHFCCQMNYKNNKVIFLDGIPKF